jgi:uncharacterized protein
MLCSKRSPRCWRGRSSRVLTDDRRSEMLELLVAASVWTEPTEIVQDCRDAKDNKYLELALAAHAVAIVSGDEDPLVLDLLVLDSWRDIRVLRPARFLEEIEAGTL